MSAPPLQKYKLLPDVYMATVFIENRFFILYVTFTFFRHTFLHIFNLMVSTKLLGDLTMPCTLIVVQDRLCPCAFYNFGP